MKLNQPYAGIFVKRDDDNQTEVVADLKELYSIGTFAQIVELQDLGSRLRMVSIECKYYYVHSHPGLPGADGSQTHSSNRTACGREPDRDTSGG